MTRTTAATRLCVAVLTISSTGCGMTIGGAGNPAVHASFTGNWVLNVAESSDTMRASVRGLERGARVERDARGSAAPRSTTPAERARAARVDGELAARVRAASRSHIERLAIADSGGVITLRSGANHSVVLSPDGSTTRQKWLDGTSSDLRARWVAQRLEVVRKIDGSITVQEYYSRSPGGSRLVVFSIVTGPFDGEITVRRVYDSVTETD
jgi:hypothetical protein